jgi:hypothetical protein
MHAAVTGCTADFTTGTVALLRGLQRQHPAVRRVCFTLPNMVPAVQGALGGLAEVLAIPRTLRHAPADPRILASWSRVFIATIAAEMVAWFDSDVIIADDASAWWQVPPGQVNAVADAAYRIRHMVPDGMEAWYFHRFNLAPDGRGFNAGVFALRPADWPDLPERFEALLAEQDASAQPFAFDQGLLNGLFQPQVNWLPREYNAHCLAECGVPPSVRVIHYTGSPKPWDARYDRATLAYEHWLRHGEGVTDERVLNEVRRARRRAVPGRVVRRGVRKLFHLLGRRPAMGVGAKPTPS